MDLDVPQSLPAGGLDMALLAELGLSPRNPDAGSPRSGVSSPDFADAASVGSLTSWDSRMDDGPMGVVYRELQESGIRRSQLEAGARAASQRASSLGVSVDEHARNMHALYAYFVGAAGDADAAVAMLQDIQTGRLRRAGASGAGRAERSQRRRGEGAMCPCCWRRKTQMFHSYGSVVRVCKSESHGRGTRNCHALAIWHASARACASCCN